MAESSRNDAVPRERGTPVALFGDAGGDQGATGRTAVRCTGSGAIRAGAVEFAGETARVGWRCGGCGAAAQFQVNQFVEPGARLRWDAELWCDACGERVCVHGGSGATPEGVHAAIAAATGGARLTLLAPPPSRVAVLRVLRESPELSGDAAPDLATARDLTDGLVAGRLTGTWCEMTLIARRLRLRGVEAVVERVAPEPGGR